MWVWHCQMLNILKNEIILAENITEIYYKYGEENIFEYSEDDQMKYLNKLWNQWIPFLCREWCKMWYLDSNY